MKELVASGKVTLHHCDVAAMPLADGTVDKVFHCNCYYFWPDLGKGATEIRRVMKPGRVWRWYSKTDSGGLVIYYLTPSFDFSEKLLSFSNASLHKCQSLLLEPTQEAWWWPHWGWPMWLLWQQSEWCQARTGAQRPTCQLWETLASLMSGWKTGSTNTLLFRQSMPLP